MAATKPHRPEDSGYAESPQPNELPRSARQSPDPEAAGNERAQVASAQHKTPGEPEPANPGEEEPLPPGEHKHEPIHDPDPADTKLHVAPSSR